MHVFTWELRKAAQGGRGGAMASSGSLCLLLLLLHFPSWYLVALQMPEK